MATYLESAERYAGIERERIRNIINANNNAIGNAPAITQAQTYSVTPTVPSAEKNKGGIIGGIGYLAEKAGAGLVSSVEGIWDFVAGGIADLVGADRWAKRQVENEWFGDWYDTAGDWYNAGSGWKVAGDIAGGIGTSIPALAGALVAGPAGWVGVATTFGIAATSAGGTSLREAYDKTGKLTGKEWAYAGMSGATEGILESVTDVLGMGIGGTVAKLGKVGGKAVAKTAAQNVAKQGIVKTAAKTAGKSFVGEAFEEGMSAILNPQYAKLTYDPNAENATAQEVAYSAFVGGMAGVVMGGGSTAYTEIKSRATANKLINDKTDGEVLTLAEALIKKDDSDPIGTSIMRDVRGAYQELKESLDSTNGEYTTGRQKYLLGRLNLLTTEATLNEATVASAIHALKNADAIAESLNVLGYTDANGNKITYTADQIREGFKTEGLGKRRAVQNALESNPILRMLSVSDAANRLLMDTSAFNEQTLSGRRIQSQKELNDYIEQASDATKSELGRALGIEDWSAANYTDVNKALASYLGDENNVKAVEKRLALKKEFEAKRDARPLVVGRASAYAAKKDGIRRYKANGNDYAIKKEGDTYTLYDYTDKIASKDLTLAELRRSLSEYDTKHNNAQETAKDTENATKEKTAPEKEAAKPKREKTPVEKSYEIAKKSVAKYDKLSANDQSMIRKIIRQGIALGVREDVIVYAANIAARTHTDVVFNKDMCAVPTKDGKHIRGYANGAYIASEKRFYFNPEAQTTDGFIIHELDHAIRKRVGADGGVTTKIFKKAIDAAGKDTYTEITKRYGTKTDVPKGKFILGKTETTEQKISKTEDEVEAFYAETALKDKDILKNLLAEKPTLKDRILNFFKGAVSDYASIPELDADAKKYYKQYRKWFAEFEKNQRGTQINTRFEGDGGDVSYSVDEDLLNFVNSVQNMQNKKIVSRRKYIISKLNDSHARLVESVFENELHKKIDLSGYSISIDGSTVSHIEEKHGKNGTSDHSMKDNKDVARVGWAVNNADNGYAARKQSGEIDYSSKYKNADGTLAPKIILEKEIGDEKIIVVECVPDASSKQVHIVSARKIKNGNGQVLNVESTDSPQPTSETLLDGISATDSVAQSTEKSNPSDENSSKKSSNFDVEYLATVESGDMETAQKMVERAARASGYKIHAYHGTNAEFTVFDTGKQGQGVDQFGAGFYFANNSDVSERYGNRMIASYLKLEKPIRILRKGERGNLFDVHITKAQAYQVLKRHPLMYDPEDSPLGDFYEEYWEVGAKEWMVKDLAGRFTSIGELDSTKMLFRDYPNELHEALRDICGFDGVQIYFETDAMVDERNDEYYVTWFPEQAKSADPVTYDDNGNVIPLSKRFDPRNSDIRYSLPNDIRYSDRDSEGNALSAEQQEFFKDSKVRWGERLMPVYHGTRRGFTVFDATKGYDDNRVGGLLWAAKDYEYAKDYSYSDEPIVMKGYLNITNLLDVGAIDNYPDYESRLQEIADLVKLAPSELEAMVNYKNPVIFDITSSKGFRDRIVELGYDGVEALESGLQTFGFVDSNQFKDTTNKAPTSNPDIRFSLPSDFDPNAPLLDENGKPIPYESFVDRGVPYAKSPEMNVGQMRKAIANAMHYKVYSKKAMLDIVKQFPGADLLHAATRDKIADSMWQSFNSFKTTEEAESYIRDMARYILSVSMKEAKVQKPVSDDAHRRFEYLRAYVNGLTFTKSDLEDIKSAKGEDGYKRIIGRWGYKARKDGKKHTTPMDVFVTDIAREMPEFAGFENMTPVDAFLALDEAYTEAKATVNDKWQSIYEDATDADLDDMLGALEHELYTAFSEAGSVTAWRARFENLLENYKKKSDYWKAQYDNENRYQRLKKMIEDDARKLRDIKTHKFANATQVENDTLDASIGKLASVMYKGNLSVKKARQAASDLLVLYRSNAFRENILEYYDQNQLGYYNEAIETYLEILSGSSDLLPAMEGHLGADEEFRENVTKQGEKGFTKNELKMLEKVMSYFINFYKNYGKVYHRGNLVEAKPLAERWVGIAQGNKDVKELLLLRSVAGQWYKDTFLDPMSLMRMADGYESGFYTEMMEQSREAMIAAQFEEMTVMRKYDEFLEKNKKYLRDSSKETVKIRGHEIAKNKLIDLYCTTKRDQAWRGLAINGYNYLDTKGKTIRVDGELDAGKRYGISEIHAAVMRLQKEIEQHLTALDLEYIEIIEEIYNVDSKRLKQERDFARQGFTNVEEGYYYPIRRGHIATNIDKAPIKEELDRVSNASFNKEIVKNAAQELCIDSADARLRRHVRAVCQYAHLSPIIEEFNRMYNYDISGNRDHPISVETETKNTWSNARDYWQKMISDMQGVTARSEMEGALSYVRGGYAIAMLSMNPKVWVTQLSSFAAASGMLDAAAIAKGGFVVSREDIDNIGKYCPLADIRKYENTAALAQGVLDRRGVKVGVGGRAMSATRKFGEWGMKPIGAMDSFVINRLFGACMLQVEKNGVAKRGTEANKIAAGKLLTQLILETQQNSMATERSAAMRSNSELLRTVTMFSADAMKVISRCVDGFCEVRVIKYHLKNKEMTAEVREQYTARLKIAKRKLRKSLAALLVSAAYMAGITALFKTLYNKWDKERKEDESLAEAVAKSMTVDFAGNLIGGLPLIRDVYSKLVEGYDVDNYAYSAINDVLNAGKKMTSIFDADATRAEKASAIRSLVYSTSSFSGIPARNMYNAVFGITKRISEPTAYKIDEVFYRHNYKTDLEKYIDQGDTKMADFILGLLYDTETTELADSTMKSLRELAELGYKVSPRAVSDSVTFDGEEYPISVAEQSAIETEYFSNLKALDRLTSSASYAKLTDEQRHYAVKSVLDVYYKKAVSDVMGTEASKSVLIASVIGAENMGVFVALVKDYEDDLDKKGEKISGTKRKKIIAAINAMPITTNQKILLMYAKGYTPKDGDIRGVSASSAKTRLLNTIVGANGLTKEQKESLAKACGLTVKNGKIIVK